MPTIILFVAFSALSMCSALVNFRHTSKAHKEDPKAWSMPVVNREDPELKARGINLPGYNH